MNALGILYRVTQGDTAMNIAERFLVGDPIAARDELRTINNWTKGSGTLMTRATLEIPLSMIRPDVDLIPANDIPGAVFLKKKGMLGTGISPVMFIGVAATAGAFLLKRFVFKRKRGR